MLAFEVQKPNKNMYWYLFANKDTSSDDTKDVYDYLTSIPITASMAITIEKQAKGGIMSVHNMRDFLPIANESFKLKFKEINIYKPPSSRKESKESFIICKKLR